MAAGRLDEQRVKQAAEVLLDHRRRELPSVSVAVAARLLSVSRTTVESWAAGRRPRLSCREAAAT